MEVKQNKVPIMGINKPFLNKLQADYTEYKCFVETGTYVGETIFTLEPYFDRLHTIEFSEKYHNNTKSKYNGNKINFILGDSSIEFKSLLPTLNEKCIFFLDGHWSGGDTGHSAKDCPLVEEMTLINDLFTDEAIIIIDDVRLFGKKAGEDWSQITKENLLNTILGRVSKIYCLDSGYAKDDRLILHINAK